MASHSLGSLTTAADKLSLDTGRTDGKDVGSRLPCHSIFVQALEANTGIGYLGDSSMDVADLSSLVGVLAIIPVPSAADGTSYPSHSRSLAGAANAYNLADYYIHGSVPGDKFLVSIDVN